MTTRSGAVLQFSPLESARFGLRVFRGSPEAIDAPKIAEEIERERIDVAILRIPAPATEGVGALAREGWTPILADTHVVYGVDLAEYERPALDPSIVLRPATRQDGALLAEMARSIFVDYESHYRANPLFAPDKILDGYAEWAARHVDADDGSAAWLVERGGDLAGFSCYRIDADGTAIGVLNGVLPGARGRGVYRGMLASMLEQFAEQGLARFEIATQTHNDVVLRVWIRSGFTLRAECLTIHINALRGRRTAGD